LNNIVSFLGGRQAVTKKIKEETTTSTEEKEEAKPAETVEVKLETEAEIDELTAIRQQLAEAEAKAAEYLDGWQRARAEFANYKRRNDQEKSDLMKIANAALIARMLPILDDFDRAFQTLPSELRSLTWIDGVFIVHRKLLATLEGEGLTFIGTEDRVFDPTIHEAVTHESSNEYEEGQIIGEVQKGYKLGDRVLRPSLVRVSAGPPAEEAKEA
jgi:molecular chaperone GrpE